MREADEKGLVTTDNRTTELRKLLDERGVEHEDSELTGFHDGTTTYYTEWGGNDDGDGANTYVEYVDGTVLRMFDATPEQAIAATLGSEINGETSDGYHTFNELYHHRAVLFSVIVRDHRELAWKAKKHHDGTMYDGMFIVGIESPSGQATYHYDLDPYWEIFDCEEREFAPEWDGHTPDEAIARIATLGGEREKALEELVRDMWTSITWMHGMSMPKRKEYRERIAEMGIEVG